MKLKNKLRIYKVALLTDIYTEYRDIYLKECILKQENGYQQAEKTAQLINFLGMDAKPTDFIIDEDVEVNELIDMNIEFKKNLELIKVLLPTKSVMAFCRSVEKTNHILRCNIQFEYQIRHILNYLQGSVELKELMLNIRDTSIFDGRRKINLRYFKKTFFAIEKSYNDIVEVQRNRTKKAY